MPVPNQDIIKMGKREPFDKQHVFGRFHEDALQQAMCNLKGETLKLYLYLGKNSDNYQLELSQKALEEWGLKKDAYYTARKKLIEIGYLTPIKDGSNIYMFNEYLSEKPKENQSVSEKPKEFSEKPKEFSEFQKKFSEKPQRNTTNTTNTTITEGKLSPNGDNLPCNKPKGTSKDTAIVVSKEEIMILADNAYVEVLDNNMLIIDSKYYKVKN